jgi:hypothetical protein
MAVMAAMFVCSCVAGVSEEHTLLLREEYVLQTSMAYFWQKLARGYSIYSSQFSDKYFLERCETTIIIATDVNYS